MGCFSHDYVCCALPLYNVGIYSMLAETFVVAMTTGVLCFASPSIISVVIPSGGAYGVGVLAILVAVLQAWGFWAVFNEKSKSYRMFVRSNIALTALAFLLSLIWIALSFARHSTAVNNCLEQFVPPGQNASTASGATLCNTFMWVQCGLLLFMWFFVAFAQAYFLTMMRIYGFEQRQDHAKYNSVYSTLGDEIALRNSIDQQQKRGYMAHERQDSNSSVKASGLRNEVFNMQERQQMPERRYHDPYGGAQGTSQSDVGSGWRSRRDDRSQISDYNRSGHQYPPKASSNISTARTAREPMHSRYARAV